ncbi:DUF481 domain-containing protein [Vibrio amylolyticus]|uniref:DUF481 domain-containing protein n=1 Tax=Vibrio amylolyticus TaxID=2847292 RepID=UPI00354FEB45
MNRFMFLILATLLSQTIHANGLSMSVGAMHQTTSSSASVGVPALGLKLSIDGEEDLNLAEKNVSPYVMFEYRFKDRHSVLVDWRTLHRSVRKSYTSTPTDIFGSQVLVGATLDLSLDIDIARVGYTYRFLSNDKVDLDVMAGLHLMSIKSAGGITAEIEGDGEKWYNYNKKEKKRSLAPLPNVGIRGAYKITPNWALTSHLQTFLISTRLFDGYIIDSSLGVQYQIMDSLHVNAQYSHYEVTAAYGDSLFDAEISMKFSGPMLSLKYDF